MFVNNWYAACIADELGGDPMRVQMLGAPFVLFRDDEGVPHCLRELCVHPGASLGGGGCAHGQIESPLRGWLSERSGRCRLNPDGP